MKAAVLHGYVGPDAPKDEQDTLDEVKGVSDALRELGHEPVAVPVTLDLKSAHDALKGLRPDFAFNLVESVEGRGRFIYLGPAILDHLGIPYTGCPTEAMFITSNKLAAKRLMSASGLPTADWFPGGAAGVSPGRYIMKSVWEHASVGMDDSSIIEAGDKGQVGRALRDCRERLGGECFAEPYIEGREFNLAILAGDDGPEVLPPSEIEFLDYPPGKPRIVHYSAKWDEDAFEYEHTSRTFEFPEEDAGLILKLKDIARGCWDVFGLRGYARVDFRVDPSRRPFILEINANPCISPESGFVSTANQAGISYVGLVERIVKAALG